MPNNSLWKNIKLLGLELELNLSLSVLVLIVHIIKKLNFASDQMIFLRNLIDLKPEKNLL